MSPVVPLEMELDETKILFDTPESTLENKAKQIDAALTAHFREKEENPNLEIDVFIGVVDQTTNVMRTVTTTQADPISCAIFQRVINQCSRAEQSGMFTVFKAFDAISLLREIKYPEALSPIRGVYGFTFPIDERRRGIFALGKTTPLCPDDELDLIYYLGNKSATIAEQLVTYDLLAGRHVTEIPSYELRDIEIARENAAKNALISALAERDIETVNHTKVTGELAVLIGRKLGFTDEELRQLRIGAELHDIGKLAIPVEIINKPEGLTDEEWKIMKKHARFTQIILSNISSLQKYAFWAGAHHEKEDGSGYPQGLEGDKIPIQSKIYAVVDIISALAETRPYRDGLPLEIIHKTLKSLGGQKLYQPLVDIASQLLFDPTVQQLIYKLRPHSQPHVAMRTPSATTQKILSQKKINGILAGVPVNTQKKIFHTYLPDKISEALRLEFSGLGD